MEIGSLASSLRPIGKGVWASSSVSGVSYPEGGHDNCLELEDHSFWFRHRNRVIASAMANFPPPGALFDVGGGNGCVTMALNSAGFESVLVEPGRHGVSNAMARGIEPIVFSCLEDAGFLEHSLPAIGIFDVLEHQDNDLAFLDLLRALLCSDGRLYVTVPAYRGLWSGDDVRAGHFRRYSLKELKAKLDKAGFVVEYGTYFFTFLPLPIMLLRVIPSFFGLERKASPIRRRNDHGLSFRSLNAILLKSLQVESEAVRRKVSIPIGGSCLAVARLKRVWLSS